MGLAVRGRVEAGMNDVHAGTLRTTATKRHEPAPNLPG
jgi:hypothetical protein